MRLRQVRASAGEAAEARRARSIPSAARARAPMASTSGGEGAGAGRAATRRGWSRARRVDDFADRRASWRADSVGSSQKARSKRLQLMTEAARRTTSGRELFEIRTEPRRDWRGGGG